MKQCIVSLLLVAGVGSIDIPAAVAAPANVAVSTSQRVAGSNAANIARAQSVPNNQGRSNMSFEWRQQQWTICRVRSFFASDIAKPLEIVYFARQGSACGLAPFYGFTFSR